MNFKTWLENEFDSSSNDPSAEVSRTGLQPQVDSEDIRTPEKDESDMIRALDGQFERLGTIMQNIESDGSDKIGKIKDFCRNVLDKWGKIKSSNPNKELEDTGLATINPSPRQINWRKDHQPLPELPRMPGPGILGNS